MPNVVQMFRARVDPANVVRLLEVRPAAIAQAQAVCPVLLRAELVRLDDDTWLDVLTWSEPDGAQRLMKDAAQLPLLGEKHSLVGEVRAMDTGELAQDHPAVIEPTLDELAVAGGDRDALTSLVRRVQHPIYQLALQFLGHPQDAQEAPQEILVRLVTRLSTSRAARSS